ncbi:heme peroxidase [Trichoderma pleuroticola]
MAWTRAVAYAVLSSHFWLPTEADYIWPNAQIDELERELYEQENPFDGPGSTVSFVDGCSGPAERALGIGRSFGAEWIRNAYHDMATADVSAGTGGLDASIVFEMDRSENVGDAFQETLGIFQGSHNTRVSMADLFAIATVMAVGACSDGKVIVPFRGGRVDAVGPGPSGVPEPQQDLPTHTLSFAKQGFDTSEMIALVACGHSVGGVHDVDFPEIVPNPVPTTDVRNPTRPTDGKAKEFVANVSQNPLAFGQIETTRSDFRIFNADGGDMISQMASSNDFFPNTCSTMFERMINTVPRDVKLTDVIKPLGIKPRKLSVTVNDDETLSITGFIRVSAALPPVVVVADLERLTTSLNLLKVVDDLISANGTQVIIHFVSRSGEALPVAIGTTSQGLTARCGYPNCSPSYTYYRFNSTIPAKQGISSFTVEIIDGSAGKATIHNNGRGGFPVSDAILPMFSLSSQSRITINGGAQLQLNLTAAVLNAEMYTNISLIVPQPSNKTAPIRPWTQEIVHMEPLSKISGTNFTLYRGIWQSSGLLTATSSHPFDLVAQGATKTVSSLFNSWDDLEFI